MSANSHTICPQCYPEVVGVDGVTEQLFLDQLDTNVRENYEFYFLDGNKLVSEYRVDCWECGWHFEVTHEDPLT